MILDSLFQEKYFVRDKLIYIEYGVLTKNGSPEAIAQEAFERIFNNYNFNGKFLKFSIKPIFIWTFNGGRPPVPPRWLRPCSPILFYSK